MKKKTFQFVKHIPFADIIMQVTGNAPFLMCSPMISDGVADSIFEYAKNHPDEVITEKLGRMILEGKVK